MAHKGFAPNPYDNDTTHKQIMVYKQAAVSQLPHFQSHSEQLVFNPVNKENKYVSYDGLERKKMISL